MLHEAVLQDTCFNSVKTGLRTPRSSQNGAFVLGIAVVLMGCSSPQKSDENAAPATPPLLPAALQPGCAYTFYLDGPEALGVSGRIELGAGYSESVSETLLISGTVVRLETETAFGCPVVCLIHMGKPLWIPLKRIVFYYARENSQFLNTSNVTAKSELSEHEIRGLLAP